MISPGLAGKSPEKTKLNPEMLDGLAAEYREAGLLVPPPDAPLLLLQLNFHETESHEIIKDYVLGWRLTPGDGKDNPGTFLVGTEVWDPSKDWKLDSPPLAVKPDLPLEVSLYQGPASFAPFDTEVWLDAAIQCQMRGYQGLVRQIIEQNPMQIAGWFLLPEDTPPDEDDPAANHFLYRETNGGDPGKALAAAAWNHWLNAVVSPNTDRAEALAHLESLFAKYREFKGKEREQLLARLRLTVRPSGAKPGSPEALIDGVVDGPNVYIHTPIAPKGFSDPNLTRLLEMGFAAMPALIDHMQDQRWLRAAKPPMDFVRSLDTAGPLLSKLVEEAAGNELFTSDDEREDPRTDLQRLARQWWAEASKVSEEAYVCGHVMPVEEPTWLDPATNSYCTWIVGRRYPQRLPEIYERLLREKPNLDSGNVADTVGACTGLSREEKLRLLRLGADSPSLARREDALGALLPLDPAEANARILRELERMPRGSSNQGGNRPPEEKFTLLVQRSDSPEVWAAFTETARRVGTELRASWISAINSDYEAPPEQRGKRIAFLGAFLNDTSAWSEQAYYTAMGIPWVVSPQQPIDPTHIIGNMAAEELGEILKVPHPVGGYPADEEQAKFRANVVSALEKQ